MSDKIKLVLSEQHAGVVKKACEAYCRGKLGQFRYMLEEIFPELDYQRGCAIEDFIRAQFREQAIEKDFHPEYYFPLYSNQNWGIGHGKVGDGVLAYEVEGTIRNYLSVKNNEGYWGSGTNFSEPLCYRGGKLSLEESFLPEIEGFNKFKDFPLSAAKSRRVHTYCVNKQWDKAWGVINKLREKGYLDYDSGGEQEIKFGTKIVDGKECPVPESYFVRVFKPRRQSNDKINDLT